MSSQELRDAMFIPQDQRANFKQVIAKRSDLVEYTSGRMKAAGAGLMAVYEAGTVVGLAATGGDAGFYKPYASTATDGSEVAIGVLTEQVVTDESGNGSLAPIGVKGTFFKDLLIGLDATAITALKAKSLVENGVNLLMM